MALQVTQAQPNQTITGVIQANPGTLAGVSSSPVGTGNYNPQVSTPTAVVQPTSTQPIQGTSPNLQPTANPQSSGPTFSFMNGATYDVKGNQISAASNNIQPSNLNQNNTGQAMTFMNGEGIDAVGNPIQTSPPQNIQANSPDTTINSGNLGSGPSNSDIQGALQDNLKNLSSMLVSLQNLGTVPPAEQALQQQVAQGQATIAGLGLQEQGLYNPADQAIALPFLTGQAQNKLVSAQLQQTVNTALLNYAQGNREFAFNSLAKVYDASRQNLLDTLQVYTQSAPQNIGTTYNPLTGNIVGTFRNPLTGAESSATVGNAGPQKAYSDSSVQSIFGIPTFVGIKPDGTVDKIPLFNANGTPNQGMNLQGGNLPSFQQTSNPQPGISDTGSLLANWTSGGVSQPGQGYQQAVYKTFQNATGTPINASTPASTLASNIPALAQGIANGEGWQNPNSIQHQLNNPGDILWAGQPNASPQTVQTSQGPKTFARFDSMQDGWNAMYGLLGKKLGATQVSQSSQGVVAGQDNSVQSAINQLTSMAPPIGQAVQKTAFGHYFVDTTQLSQNLQDGASALVPSISGGQIKVFTPDITQNIKSINTTMGNLKNIEGLIQSLPNDPMDGVDRVANYYKANLGLDPTLAQLQESWQAILPDLQAQIGTQGISRLATGFLSNPQLSIVPSVTSARTVAQAMLDQAAKLIGNRENQLFGGSPPPIDYNQAANDLINNGPGSDPIYNSLNNVWTSLSTPTLATNQ